MDQLVDWIDKSVKWTSGLIGLINLLDGPVGWLGQSVFKMDHWVDWSDDPVRWINGFIKLIQPVR